MKRRMTFVALKAIYATVGSFIASRELLWAETKSIEPGAWSLSARFFFFGLVLDRAWKEKKYSGRGSNWRSSFRDFFTWHMNIFNCACESNRELKQSRRRRQQKPHKFAYLTMKNSVFARFARAFFTLRSRSFYDVKWPVLQLCGRREHMMTNVQMLSSYVPSADSNLIPK